jgi:CBS-domain-containing membrane protein
MKKFNVKDVMVPVSDYATVAKNATLFDAMIALENKDLRHGDKPYRHSSVLVVDSKGRVNGKLSQVDIMAALEPNYKKFGPDLQLNRIGFSMAFIKAVQSKFNLWDLPIEELVDNLKQVEVKDVMYTPADHQKVQENDSLETVMHQIVMGRHHSLLVTRGKKIIGILRSTDVFNKLFDLIINQK